MLEDKQRTIFSQNQELLKKIQEMRGYNEERQKKINVEISQPLGMVDSNPDIFKDNISLDLSLSKNQEITSDSKIQKSLKKSKKPMKNQETFVDSKAQKSLKKNKTNLKNTIKKVNNTINKKVKLETCNSNNFDENISLDLSKKKMFLKKLKFLQVFT